MSGTPPEILDIAEIVDRWEEIMARVEAGKPVVIAIDGVPKARLEPITPVESACVATGPASIGFMRNYANEMDEIVEDAMRRRQISGWLPNRDDFSALEAISEATGQPLTALLDDALRQFLQLRNDRTP